MSNIILFLPIILILSGVLAIIIPKRIRKIYLLIIVVTIPLLLIKSNNILDRVVYDWFGDGSYNLVLEINYTKLLFFILLLVSIIIYSFANLSSNETEEPMLLISGGGMALAIFAGDFITFFIGWEIMSWSSYIPLINRNKDVKAARRYLVYGLFGAAMILTGILLAGLESSFEFTEFVVSKSSYFAIPFLITGFLLKSGIMPLHHWIPSVYNEASDTLSSFFSGALSKAGIYGFMLLFILYPHNLLGINTYISWLGAFTALFATFRAIMQVEIKKLLAWSSIAQLGYIVASLGLGTAEGVGAGLYHTVLHTTIKLLLFIVIAGVINRTGKTRFDELGGLIKQMPFSFIAVLIGIIALAGMPPLGGFASKWAIYSALLSSGKVFELIVIIAASTAAFLYNFKLIYGIFLGHPTQCIPENTKEIKWGYILGSIIPLIILIFTGLFPSYVYKFINPVLNESGFNQLLQNNYKILSSSMGEYNGFVVMTTFGITFAVILLLFSLIKSKSRNAHRLDIAYAGEIPNESYPLHFGYGLGREIRRIPFIGFWLSKSTGKFYAYIHSLMVQISSVVRVIFTGDITTFLYILIIGLAVFWVFVSGGSV